MILNFVSVIKQLIAQISWDGISVTKLNLYSDYSGGWYPYAKTPSNPRQATSVEIKLQFP